MAILPDFDVFKDEMTESEYKIYGFVHYLLIIMYALLLCLCLTNIWRILIKQGKWKTLPLLAFYILSFIAIASREICNIWVCIYESWVFVLSYQQPVAKLMVGLVQAWMIFELTVRIRKGVTAERSLSYRVE